MRITTITMTLLTVMTIASYGQNKCDVKIEHTITGNSHAGYSISLESRQIITNVKIQLYDLYEGKVIQETEVASLASKQEIFTNVKASLYTIYVRHSDCEKARSIGSIEGIKIGSL